MALLSLLYSLRSPLFLYGLINVLRAKGATAEVFQQHFSSSFLSPNRVSYIDGWLWLTSKWRPINCCWWWLLQLLVRSILTVNSDPPPPPSSSSSGWRAALTTININIITVNHFIMNESTIDWSSTILVSLISFFCLFNNRQWNEMNWNLKKSSDETTL